MKTATIPLIIIVLILLQQTIIYGQQHNIEGPHIFHIKDSNYISLRLSNEMLHIDRARLGKEYYTRVHTHDSLLSFYAPVTRFETPLLRYQAPRKIFVVSAPTGDLEAFATLLQQVKVIDSNFQWRWKRNHLVILGNAIGDGPDVTALLWMIRKLEVDAQESGGRVHFILGENEKQLLLGYNQNLHMKYNTYDTLINHSYTDLLSSQNHLGAWLRTKNIFQVIGDNLFVHGGISTTLSKTKLPFEFLNDYGKRLLSVDTITRSKIEDPLRDILLGDNGPFHYKGIAISDSKHSPISMKQLITTLNDYGVKRLFIGNVGTASFVGKYEGQAIIVSSEKSLALKEIQAGILIYKDQFEVIDKYGGKEFLSIQE